MDITEIIFIKSVSDVIVCNLHVACSGCNTNVNIDITQIIVAINSCSMCLLPRDLAVHWLEWKKSIISYTTLINSVIFNFIYPIIIITFNIIVNDIIIALVYFQVGGHNGCELRLLFWPAMEYKEISSYRSIVANTTAILSSPHSRNAPHAFPEDTVDGGYTGIVFL